MIGDGQCHVLKSNSKLAFSRGANSQIPSPSAGQGQQTGRRGTRELTGLDRVQEIMHQLLPWAKQTHVSENSLIATNFLIIKT